MSTLHARLYRVYATLRRKWLQYWYRGSTYLCPFCGHSYRKLIPGGSLQPVWEEKNMVGGGWRENLYCPTCYSSDKERLAYRVLEKRGLFAPTGATLRVLHIAPERNLAPKIRANARVEYISGDITPGRAMEVVDLTRMQFMDESFDVVICSHVLEHIPDDAQAMREIYRVLKSGGYALLQVPLSLSLEHTFEDPQVVMERDRDRVFGQSDHVRIYGQDYVARLKKAGFAITPTLARELFSANEVRASGINGEEPVFIAEKQ